LFSSATNASSVSVAISSDSVISSSSDSITSSSESATPSSGTTTSSSISSETFSDFVGSFSSNDVSKSFNNSSIISSVFGSTIPFTTKSHSCCKLIRAFSVSSLNKSESSISFKKPSVCKCSFNKQLHLPLDLFEVSDSQHYPKTVQTLHH